MSEKGELVTDSQRPAPPEIGLPATLVDVDGFAFTPACLDCGYSLAGVVNFRCPECGQAFSVNQLERHARALRESRERNRSLVKGALLPLLLVGSIFGFGIESNSGAAVYLIIMVFLGGLQATMLRHVLVLQSAWWLVGLLPLTTLAIGMLTSPHPTYWLVGCGVAAMVLSYLALRDSPLVSAILLLGVYVVPLSLLGIAVHTHAASRMQAGLYWTDCDRPTPTGWKALPAPAARGTSLWMTAGAVGVGCVVPWYARRAWVRARRKKRASERTAETRGNDAVERSER